MKVALGKGGLLKASKEFGCLKHKNLPSINMFSHMPFCAGMEIPGQKPTIVLSISDK